MLRTAYPVVRQSRRDDRAPRRTVCTSTMRVAHRDAAVQHGPTSRWPVTRSCRHPPSLRQQSVRVTRVKDVHGHPAARLWLHGLCASTLVVISASLRRGRGAEAVDGLFLDGAALDGSVCGEDEQDALGVCAFGDERLEGARFRSIACSLGRGVGEPQNNFRHSSARLSTD